MQRDALSTPCMCSSNHLHRRSTSRRQRGHLPTTPYRDDPNFTSPRCFTLRSTQDEPDVSRYQQRAAKRRCSPLHSRNTGRRPKFAGDVLHENDGPLYLGPSAAHRRRQRGTYPRSQLGRGSTARPWGCRRCVTITTPSSPTPCSSHLH